MNGTILRKLFLVFVAAAAVGSIVGANSFSVGQEAKVKGRLPAYYGDIVTDEQRQKIYEVQAKYSAKLAALKSELETLETKRDKEVADVLDAKQKAKLKKAQEDGAAKRKKTAADKKAEEIKAANKKAN